MGQVWEPPCQVSSPPVELVTSALPDGDCRNFFFSEGDSPTCVLFSPHFGLPASDTAPTTAPPTSDHHPGLLPISGRGGRYRFFSFLPLSGVLLLALGVRVILFPLDVTERFRITWLLSFSPQSEEIRPPPPTWTLVVVERDSSKSFLSLPSHDEASATSCALFSSPVRSKKTFLPFLFSPRPCPPSER